MKSTDSQLLQNVDLFVLDIRISIITDITNSAATFLQNSHRGNEVSGAS